MLGASGCSPVCTILPRARLEMAKKAISLLGCFRTSA